MKSPVNTTCSLQRDLVSLDVIDDDTEDVADDRNRLFPRLGLAFEKTGAVRTGRFGSEICRICGYSDLIGFASQWINDANIASGDRH